MKKDITATSSSSKRRTWIVDDMLSQARELLTTEQYRAFTTLREYSVQHADSVRLGSGKIASFNPIWKFVCDKSLFSAFANGKLQVNYHWLEYEDGSNRDVVNRLLGRLRDIGFNIPNNYHSTVTTYEPDEWAPRVDALLKVLEEIHAS